MNELASSAPTANTTEDIHRPRPIGVFLSGESFFDAARYLQTDYEAEKLRLRFTMPIYYLYCHALELTLKAFLRTKGLSEQELASRKFGHKLKVLWGACVDQGLCKSGWDAGAFASTEKVIKWLDPFARTFEFRYLEIGFKQLPPLTDIQSAGTNLMAAVKSHCITALLRDNA